MRYLMILLLMTLALVGCSSAKQAAPGAGVSLLIVGDSLTAGYGLDDPKISSWPALLEARWKSEGFLTADQSVVNAGISGDTSEGGLARLEDLLDRHNPRAVAIALGSNDVRRQSGAANLNSNLSKMTQTVQRKNIRVILIGVNLPTGLSFAASGQPNKTIDQVAREHDVARADIPLNVVARKNLMLEDQIHPGKEAQGIIAEALRQPLEHIMAD